ncbi:hypothetical protein FAP59_18805 [Morganella morganii]|nr:hypothetical protein [Morganella morganii]
MQNETQIHRQRLLTSLECSSGIPDKIQRKAKRLLLRHFSGEHLCKKVKCYGKKGGIYPALKIDIGVFWRLLSLDNGESWQLMSHERYNKIISRS